MSMLKADLRVGETLSIEGSGSCRLTMTAKSGQRARFEIVADKTMKIKLPAHSSVRDVVSSGIAARP